MAKDEDTLEEGKEAFDLIVEHEADNRKSALDDINFARLSDQWPEYAKNLRKDRPMLTINKLPVYIRNVINDARQNRPAIKVHAVDSKADPAIAEIYNGIIRNIETTSRADVAYDTALDAAASGGFGYFRVAIKHSYEDSFDKDIAIERIANQFSVYGDCYSSSSDSSDWNTTFIVDTLSRSEFKKRWKGAEEIDWDNSSYASLKAPWSEDKKIMIAEWWSREPVKTKLLFLSDESAVLEEVYKTQKDALDASGITVIGSRPSERFKVIQRIMTGAEVLETNDWPGRYIPVIPVYGEEINVEGKRYFRSLIHDAKDAQVMFNFWRTATTELVALAPKAPFIGPRGAFKSDQDRWETANTESHAYLEYDGQVPPQRQPFSGVPAGALQEALNASDDMKAIIGMYDASLGARSNETSGVAINARKVEGDISTFHFVDNQSRAIEHGGRVVLDLIPKVYKVGRMVRTLGQDKKSTTIQLGAPMPVTGPDGKPMMDAAGIPMTRILDLGVGKYDLTVETGPNYETRRQESAAAMTELIRAFPASAPVIGPRLAKSSDWPDAEEIGDELKALVQSQMGGGGAKPPAPPDPVAMAQLQADAQKNQTDAQLKQMELKIKEFAAVTDRMEAVFKANEQRMHAMMGGMPTPQPMQ